MEISYMTKPARASGFCTEERVRYNWRINNGGAFYLYYWIAICLFGFFSNISKAI
jgi:hypothetical protein